MKGLLYHSGSNIGTLQEDDQWPRDSFLETLDNFPGPVSIFSSSLIYLVMVIIGANLAICFTKL